MEVVRVFGSVLIFYSIFATNARSLKDLGLFPLSRWYISSNASSSRLKKKVQQFTFSSDKVINMRHDYNQFVVTAFICQGARGKKPKPGDLIPGKLIDFFELQIRTKCLCGVSRLIWQNKTRSSRSVLARNKKPVNNYQLYNDRLSPTELQILIS